MVHLPAAGKCQSTPDDIAMPDGLVCLRPCFCFYHTKKVPCILSFFAFWFIFILFLLSLCILIASCSVSACTCCSIQCRSCCCLCASVALYSLGGAVCVHASVAVYSLGGAVCLCASVAVYSLGAPRLCMSVCLFLFLSVL